MAFKGFIYESLNEKELSFVYDKMHHAMEDLNTVLNAVHDGNQKKAISSLMNKTIDTFNEKIKGVDYHPAELDDLQRTSDRVDAKLDEQQLSDSNSAAETKPEQREIADEKYA